MACCCIIIIIIIMLCVLRMYLYIDFALFSGPQTREYNKNTPTKFRIERHVILQIFFFLISDDFVKKTPK